MKKLFGLFVIASLMASLVLGSSVFGAVKKPAVQKQRYAFGVAALPTTFNGFSPILYSTFKSEMGDYSATVGIGYGSVNAGAGVTNSNFSLIEKTEYKLTEGKVSTHLALLFAYVSDSNVFLVAGGASRTSYSLGVAYGTTISIDKNFDVTADLIPIIYTTGNTAGVAGSVLNIGSAMLSAHYYF